MIICRRPVHLGDHLQEAFNVGVVVVGGGGVSFMRPRKTKKEMKENIWRWKINGDANQPTDRANTVQSAFWEDGK